LAPIAKAWPDKNIAFVADTRKMVFDMTNALCKEGIEAFGFTAQKEIMVDTKVAVTTFAGLAFAPVEPQKQDIVVVLDPLLSRSVDVTDGLKSGGLVIVNHPGTYAETGLAGNFKIATVDATKIALDVIGRPITNTAILGAFAKATGLVKLESLEEAVKGELPSRIIATNVEAMRRAYAETSAPADASGLKKAEIVKKASTQPLISYSRVVSDWRVSHPVIDEVACVGCKRCWVYCPETAIGMVEGKAEVNYDYCKGCGICAEECLVHAIKMEREEV